MNYYKIANRNVGRQKRRSRMLTFAIAFGTCVIILLNSLTSGFVQNTEKGITDALGGHIYIYGEELLDSGKNVDKISDTDILGKAIESVNPSLIKAIHKRSVVMGTLIFHSKSYSNGLTGVNWNDEETLKESLEFYKGGLEGINDSNTIILTKGSGDKLGVDVGDIIIDSFETVTGQKNVENFKVIGILKENKSDTISTNYTSIESLNAVIGLEPTEYQNVTIELNNANNINRVQKTIENSITEAGGTLPAPVSDETNVLSTFGMSSFLPNVDQVWTGTRFTIKNLNDFMNVALQFINIIDYISYAIFIIMILITMLGLVNTFRLIMQERVNEIGTMRAMGMHKKDVKKLFYAEGVLISLKGVPYGIVIAIIIERILSLIPINSKIPALKLMTNSGHLSFPIQLPFILLVALIITTISLFAVSRPVNKALKKSVADELR